MLYKPLQVLLVWLHRQERVFGEGRGAGTGLRDGMSSRAGVGVDAGVGAGPGIVVGAGSVVGVGAGINKSTGLSVGVGSNASNRVATNTGGMPLLTGTTETPTMPSASKVSESVSELNRVVTPQPNRAAAPIAARIQRS